MWIRKCDAELEEEEEDSTPSSEVVSTPKESTTEPQTDKPVETIDQETKPVEVSESKPAESQATSEAPKPKVRYEWFQTDDSLTMEIYAKDLKEDDVNIVFSKKNLDVTLKLGSSSEYNMDIDLAGEVQPDACKYTIRKSCVEILLKKVTSSKWKTLEFTGEDAVAPWDSNVVDQPSLSKPGSKKDWDKIAVEDEPLEGDAELNKLFQDIFSKGSDEQRKAMLKSFYESGGTVLSTNWEEVGKAPVKVAPPKGMEVHRWDENK